MTILGTFWYIALLCLPAPLVAVALLVLARRLTRRRAILAAVFAQWIVVVALATRARPWISGCSRADPACLHGLVSPLSGHDLLHFRLQLLLWLGIGGTLSAVAVGFVATWLVRRMWSPGVERRSLDASA